MTFAPPTIVALAHEWVSNEGANLGIVGDANHVRAGTSYHLGRSQLHADAYSRRLPRDVAGLSEAAAAIDLGQLHGSLANLQRFSRWLVGVTRDHPDRYRDIREIIFSPDGVRVQRWDNWTHTLYAGGTGTGQGDNTHLWHTHISFFRDSEFRDKRFMFSPYFAGTTVPPDSGAEEAVHSWLVPELRSLAMVKAGAWLHWYSDRRALTNTDPAKGPVNIKLSANRELVDHGLYEGSRVVGYEAAAGDTGTTSRAMFVDPADIASYRNPPAGSSITPADLVAAHDKGYTEAKTKAVGAVKAI